MRHVCNDMYHRYVLPLTTRLSSQLLTSFDETGRAGLLEIVSVCQRVLGQIHRNREANIVVGHSEGHSRGVAMVIHLEDQNSGKCTVILKPKSFQC